MVIADNGQCIKSRQCVIGWLKFPAGAFFATRAYHILRACSSVVLSKFQHLPIRTVQQN